jgi:hypothetical protein
MAVMCGPHSALGLEDVERAHWPRLREELRRPGHLMALMRGILGGDTEIGCVTAVTPAGVVHPVAVLVTPAIADEINLLGQKSEAGERGVRRARIGDDDVEVLVGDDGEPLAVLMNDWLFHHLTLYTRKLWSRR